MVWNSSELAISWAFITKAEGGVWTVGYVPNKGRKSDGKIRSGVTIANGVDLGSLSEAQLKELMKFGLSQELHDKLKRFCNKRGAIAVMALDSIRQKSLDLLRKSPDAPDNWQLYPTGIVQKGRSTNYRNATENEKPTQFINDGLYGLRISGNEAEMLKNARQSYGEYRLVTNFNKISKISFSNLSPGIQTALMSISWHTGDIWVKSHKAHDAFLSAANQDDAETLAKAIIEIPQTNDGETSRRRDEARLVSNDYQRKQGIKRASEFDKFSSRNRTS